MAQPQKQVIQYPRSQVKEGQVVTADKVPTENVIYFSDEAKAIQQMSRIPWGSTLRRLAFIWFKVYVRETKRGKHEKVNVRIPIPIPIIGAAMAKELSFQKAAKLAAAARRGEDVTDLLESAMGFEFVRVEDDQPERGKSSLVVVGLD